jgi:uncharacterized protein YbjT (DUF2867 family)
MPSTRTVFITGATGYLGRPLAARLLERGHRVRALVRPSSTNHLPAGCTAVAGDALDGASYAAGIAPADTFVHLVGVAHPSPAKAAQFRSIDLASAEIAAAQARAAGVRRFVYVSVAQPAPVMKAYLAARAAAESAIRTTGLDAVLLRPWYVLGPGHRWPILLRPLYALASLLPRTRPAARRLALVTLPQMLAALLRAVEDDTSGVQVVEVPAIRAG